MGTKEAVKRNISSMQVLKTLQLLLEDNYTMSTLIEKLNENEKEPIFNNSVVSKYINTCRFCGIDIPKIHNKYFVASMPFGLNLTPRELDLLDVIQTTVQNTMTKNANNVFEKFITRLSRYSNKRIMRVEPQTKQMVFDLFDTAIAEKRKIRLMFRVKNVYDCIPVSIGQRKGKTCFNVIHKNREKSIAVDRISGLEILDDKYQRNDSQEVVFKLTGSLAKSYDLRLHEKIVNDSLPDSITVSNIGENKEELFARLLRYDASCEILLPLHYREEMKSILDKMLSRYEG